MCDACKNAAREALTVLTGPQQDAVEGFYRTAIAHAEEEAARERRIAVDAECQLEAARSAFAELRRIAKERALMTEDLKRLGESLEP